MPWTFLLLVACTAPEPSGGDTPDEDSGETGAPEPDLEPLLSFVIIADPHVYGGGANEANLRSAVEWVNAAASAQDIAFVAVVGDIAWSGGVDTAVSLLGALEVPWLPVIGDNEIQGGSEAAWAEAFAPQLSTLAGTFSGWSEAERPVWDPVDEVDAWLWSYAFDHAGLRVVALDWCARVTGTVFGEMADLHDFDGGTLPWFEAELGALDDGASERVILLSHHPMHMSPGSFDTAEITQLWSVTSPVADVVAGGYGGHYHATGDEAESEGGYEVFVTAAVHGDGAPVRLVRVSTNGLRFAYEQEIVETVAH